MAPTSSRFMTLRLPMSGTSPETAAARTETERAAGLAVAHLRESPRTPHPSLPLGIWTCAEVMERAAMVLELVERGGGVSGKGCGAKYGVVGSEAGNFIAVGRILFGEHFG